VRQQCVLLAVMLIACQSPTHESSTEQAAIVVPAAFDFGMQQLRSTSATHTVTVSPAGGPQSDMITSVAASCPDFVVSAPGLPAPVTRTCKPASCTNQVCPAPDATGTSVICQTAELETYPFDTAFRPTVAGTVSCVVTVTIDDARTRTITLTGTGVAPQVAVDVQPDAIAFGEVRSGGDSTLATVSVHSAGSSDLAVSSVSTSSGFTITSGPTAAYSLPANMTQVYKVACHPSAVGAMTGQFEVRSNDPDQNRMAVALSCNGIDSNLAVEPSPATLDTTRVGEPVDLTVELRNTGTAPMKLDDVKIVGAAFSLAPGLRLPMTLSGPSDVATVDIHFEAAAAGDASGTLIATYDGNKTRSTHLAARALPTSLALTPDGDVDFGPVCIGQRKTKGFVLIANQQGWFELGSISDPEPPFAVDAPPLPMTVAGNGGTATFQIAAAPEAPGVVTATTTVHTDIPHGADHPVHLSVHGLPMGVTATPDSLDLGTHEVNTTAIGQEAQLSNCGASPIAFSGARIEGPDASEFAIVSAPPSSMIAPNGLVTWLIVLQAHSVGPKQAVFAVDHDGGTETIDLLGEGISTAGRGSYYACSTGRPVALWPLAAALLALRRRGRRRT
jgi:hypothetical protein